MVYLFSKLLKKWFDESLNRVRDFFGKGSRAAVGQLVSRMPIDRKEPRKEGTKLFITTGGDIASEAKIRLEGK